MPMIQTDSQHYTDIADAIRDMSGSSEVFYPADMAGGVRSIPQTIAIAPIIYSLEEREVGVWTDGKPLYQKTIVYHSTDNTGQEINKDVSSLHIDTCVYIYGTTDRLPNGYQTPTTYVLNSIENNSFNFYTFLRYTNIGDRITYRIKLGDSTVSTQKITLLYTKTTDTPGSGTWTPSGVPAHHYSTEEQVIGTWIDRKTLYEKTYVYPVASAISSTTTLFTIPGIRVKKIDAYGIGYNEGAVYPIPWNGEGWETGIKFVGEQLILNVRGTYWDNNYSFVITLQYTKTS